MMVHHKNDQITSDCELRETILSYLNNCSNAADTIEGVISWWLPRQRYNDSYKNILRILEQLVDEKTLLKTRLPDGNVIYACNKNNTTGDQG